MTREEIVALFARRDAAWKALDAAALTADHSPECVYESPLAGEVVGRTPIEAFYRGLFASFPDIAVETTDLVIEGDRAVQIVAVSGTDRGGFMGLPPTGKRFRFAAMASYTLKDGLITRQESVYDFTGWLVQVGVLKAKPQ
jgi:steroid delta-isomerase-like uncharacterized protein